jgi:hypothetical protein
MQNFAEQCLDMAKSILGHNLDSIHETGTILPVSGEQPRDDEPGHAALAIGEYYRATHETELGGKDLIDLAARAITAQAFMAEELENGLAYSALGLLSFGPPRIAIWFGSACSTPPASNWTSVCWRAPTMKTIFRSSTSPRP